MQITFTGTGGAGGVPRYGCDCVACCRARQHPEYQRRPCSGLIETARTRLLLDAGLMDIHERFAAGSLDAILLTHFHADHVQGLFHLRWGKAASLPVYCPPDPEGCADLYKNAGMLEFRHLAAFTPLVINDLKITPLPLNHSKLTFGYGIETEAGERFAYLTDTLGLPEATRRFLQSWGPFSLALDCSHTPRAERPANHNDLNLALETIRQVTPQRAWLTHLSHEVDRWRLETSFTLPPHVDWARDDLTIPI